MRTIKNIRYGEIKDGHGTILFNFGNETIVISEPKDVMLVGAPHDLAEKWIFEHYGFLLGIIQ